MVLRQIQAMLESCTTDFPLFPPTDLYNETWLLRLVLDWFSRQGPPGHFLSVPEGGRWFSEAWLPSPFLRRPGPEKDGLAESWTHADAVVGHFNVGEKGKADIRLTKDTTHLVVLEAKMFSRLSSGVTNAPYYDQAARTVACIAEVLKRARRSPSSLTCLGFYVLAPESQVKRGVFVEQLNLGSINEKVKQRISVYEGERDAWYSEWFQPTLACMVPQPVSWEDLIEEIGQFDGSSTASIRTFYDRCVEFSG